MTKQDYNHLECLLGKLARQFDEKYAVSITPGVVHDGYNIGLYYKETGKAISNASGIDIQDAISKLKSSNA